MRALDSALNCPGPVERHGGDAIRDVDEQLGLDLVCRRGHWASPSGSVKGDSAQNEKPRGISRCS